MRRPRGGEEVELVDVNLAQVLMLLSQRAAEAAAADQMAAGPDQMMLPERVFECKTCNRQFPSFQALGGHRASHKKPRLLDVDGALLPKQPPKPRIHECSICGLEFALGQALGGHMRRHRAAGAAAVGADTSASTSSTQRVDEVGKKMEDAGGGTSVAQIRRAVHVFSAVAPALPPPLDLNEPAAPLDGDRDPLELSLRTFAPEASIVH